VRIHCR